jgi:ABC-type transport system involved in multi-copper enzyme maturation permease subunit
VESLIAVAAITLKEHIRNRIYLTVILFGLLLIGASVIISSLAVEEQVRMMLDIGLGGIEFLALLAVVFVTVNLVLQEMESRSLYLILSHPVRRWQYIVGRYLGTVAALAAGIVLMGALHVASLLLAGWTWEFGYLIALLMCILKIAVVASLALLVSLITTSTPSAMTLTGFLWVMGHFTSELTFIGEKSANPLVKAGLQFFQYVAPNFSYLNYRDFWHATATPPGPWFGWTACYVFSYIGVMLVLTSWAFSKKEF